MPDTKISAMTAGAPALSTDEVVVARSSANRRLTLDQVLALSSRRNLVINGAFDVAQRGTSHAVTTANAYCLDRFTVIQSGVAQCTASQAAPAPALTGFKNCLKLLQTGTSNGAISILQAFETVDSIKLAGQEVTLSFWALKGSTWTPPSLGVRGWTSTGTDQSASTVGAWTGVASTLSSSCSPTTSWVRYTFTFTIPAATTQIAFDCYAFPTGGAVDANSYLMLTGFQLEPGATASPFEFRHRAQELALCQRYYEKSYAQGTAAPTNAINAGLIYLPNAAAIANSGQLGRVAFAVTKRVAPTVTVYSYTNSAASVVSNNAGTDLAANSGVPVTIGDSGFGIQNQSGGNITPSANTFICHYAASAEL